MLRTLKTALVAGLVLAFAPVAFADEDIDTYLRNGGHPTFMNGSAFKDPSAGVDTRGRLIRGSGSNAVKAWQDNASRPE